LHLINVLYAPQAALGNPEAYIGNFPYELAAGTYNIDPSFDPAASNPTGKPLQDGSRCRHQQDSRSLVADVLCVHTSSYM